MVKAADILWNARGGHDPTVAAASTQQSRSPAPSSGKIGDKKSSNACSKSLKTLAMACVNFTIIMPIRLTGVLRPVLGRKTSLGRRATFGSAANHTHELKNGRYLVDAGATLSIIPCSQNASPSGPLLKVADGQPIPSLGFI
jgi:hypothetical protein